jgi:hypothetical protein
VKSGNGLPDGQATKRLTLKAGLENCIFNVNLIGVRSRNKACRSNAQSLKVYALSISNSVKFWQNE